HDSGHRSYEQQFRDRSTSIVNASSTKEPVMGELMRFRQIRAPQRRAPAAKSLVTLDDNHAILPEAADRLLALVGEGAAAEQLNATFATHRTFMQYVVDNCTPASGLFALDQWLAAYEAVALNVQPTAAELKAKVHALLGKYLPPNTTSDWQTLHSVS